MGEEGKRWFAVESKSFDISVEELGGRLRGVIVERGRGYSRWVRLGSLVYAAFWQEWKLVVEMLGCRGGVKGGRREEGFSGWNVWRMGLEGSYSTRWSRQNKSVYLWFSWKEKETMGVGSSWLRNYGRSGLFLFLRKRWIHRLRLGVVGRLKVGRMEVGGCRMRV